MAVTTYTDIMIDLETLSTRYDAAILQIAAIKFNRNHDDRELFENIWINGQDYLKTPDRFFNLPVVADQGHIDPETVRWWLGQSDAARSAVATAVAGEAEALTEFGNWMGSTRGQKIWAKSPSADCVWLKSAHTRNGMSLPWSFREEQDVRTVQTLARDSSGKSIKTWKIDGSHDALIDCALQIYQVQESYRMMRS